MCQQEARLLRCLLCSFGFKVDFRTGWFTLRRSQIDYYKSRNRSSINRTLIYAIICRWKRNLASTCLGRCEDVWVIEEIEFVSPPLGDTKLHILECCRQHGICEMAALSSIMFLFRLSVVPGLFLNVLPFNRLHKKKSGGVTSGYRIDQSHFDIIPFPKKLSISLQTRLHVWHVAPSCWK